eukprot:CAMPEP_0115005354 /NCGR_PEP_ID=MMETSP0216-20121206/19807_1 /TAXON_ID=223996 /ORGANISM="Protocruzia adherens, Strain Boccale" /LENGTH=516 /DNA_ID=CAMNT_0002371635 /DNA_START=306 /DNA_END=1856 /DNA_ORIENTATION=-
MEDNLNKFFNLSDTTLLEGLEDNDTNEWIANSLAHEGKDTLDDLFNSDCSSEGRNFSDLEFEMNDSVAVKNEGASSKGASTDGSKNICSYCDKPFPSPSALRNHVRKHTGERPFKCDVCHKAFPSKGNLKTHKRIHTGERPYKCPFEGCVKCFITQGHLSDHIRSHNQERQYQCTECGQRFMKSSSLKIHLRRHRGEKPYKCNFCGQGFPERGNLNNHLRKHTNERPFECPFPECGKRFKWKCNLKEHLNTKLHKDQIQKMDLSSPSVSGEMKSLLSQSLFVSQASTSGSDCDDSSPIQKENEKFETASAVTAQKLNDLLQQVRAKKSVGTPSTDASSDNDDEVATKSTCSSTNDFDKAEASPKLVDAVYSQIEEETKPTPEVKLSVGDYERWIDELETALFELDKKRRFLLEKAHKKALAAAAAAATISLRKKREFQMMEEQTKNLKRVDSAKSDSSTDSKASTLDNSDDNDDDDMHFNEEKIRGSRKRCKVQKTGSEAARSLIQNFFTSPVALR